MALAFSGLADFADLSGDFRNAASDGFQRGTGFASMPDTGVGFRHSLPDRIDRLACFRLDVLDHLADFSRGLSRLFGQLADFIRNHSKAATLLAGAGGFNRRVERQQVGLIGNFLDHRDDRANFLRAAAEFFDRGRGVVDGVMDAFHASQAGTGHANAIQRGSFGFTGLLRGKLGAFADVDYGVFQVGNCAGNFSRATVHLINSAMNLARLRADGVGINAHFTAQFRRGGNQLAQCGCHIVEALNDFTQRVMAFHGTGKRKVSFRDGACHMRDPFQFCHQDGIHDPVIDRTHHQPRDDAANDKPGLHAGFPFDEEGGIERKYAGHEYARAKKGEQHVAKNAGLHRVPR